MAADARALVAGTRRIRNSWLASDRMLTPGPGRKTMDTHAFADLDLGRNIPYWHDLGREHTIAKPSRRQPLMVPDNQISLARTRTNSRHSSRNSRIFPRPLPRRPSIQTQRPRILRPYTRPPSRNSSHSRHIPPATHRARLSRHNP